MPSPNDGVFDKDPNAVLDYTADWRALLWLPTSDNIIASKWILPGLELISASQSGMIATFTTAVDHNYTIGNQVYISGVTPLGYNGLWTILGMPTGVTFTATLDTLGLGAGTDFGTSASPPELRIVMDSYDDDKAVVWLSRGTVGQSYPVINRIMTQEGRTDDRTITVNVKQK